MARNEPYRVERAQVVRLWLLRQGLSAPRSESLSEAALVELLEATGGLQLDSVNVLARAHHTTLWSRFGAYDRAHLDAWVYRDRLAFEYWGHEASLRPMAHLPLGRRAMRRFKIPSGAWWNGRRPEPRTYRHVLKRLREEGPLECADFEQEAGSAGWWDWKEEKIALEVLWRMGKVAIADRRHFRRVYDLAERVYPACRCAPLPDYLDSWLLLGLRGNGIAPLAHLVHYLSAPRLSVADKKAVVERNLKRKRVVPVTVEGESRTWYATPDALDGLGDLPEPAGTTLICPFDSLLWQRKRAEELLGFRYRIEIYVPEPKREWGYYVMPILHAGRLVGRLDPKLHRAEGRLEIKGLWLEPGVKRTKALEAGIGESVRSLGEFVGAQEIALPKGWGRIL